MTVRAVKHTCIIERCELNRLGYTTNTLVWTYISGVLDLFLPLKNSGRARLSISCILKKKRLKKKC